MTNVIVFSTGVFSFLFHFTAIAIIDGIGIAAIMAVVVDIVNCNGVGIIINDIVIFMNMSGVVEVGFSSLVTIAVLMISTLAFDSSSIPPSFLKAYRLLLMS